MVGRGDDQGDQTVDHGVRQAKADDMVVPQFGSPLGKIGIATGAVIVGLGVLIAGVRHLIVSKLSDTWKRKERFRRRTRLSLRGT